MKRALAGPLAALRIWLAAMLLAGPGTGGAQLGQETASRLAARAVAAVALAAAGLGAEAAFRPGRAAASTPVVPALGTGWAWGNNVHGQLGNLGTSGMSAVPTPVPVVTSDGSGTFTNALAAAAGDVHVLTVRNDLTLWAWGDNVYGELGQTADPLAHPKPAQVSGLSNVISVAAGTSDSLAVTTNGTTSTVWAWGYGPYGELGPGVTACSPPVANCYTQTPTQVTGLPTNVVAVAAGGYVSLALTQDGQVWAWGDDGYDQLGFSVPGPCDGNEYCTTTPGQVGGITGRVVAIAEGGDHSLALTSDGHVWAWGANDWGQLGAGSSGSCLNFPAKACSLTPLEVAGPSGGFLSNVVAIAAAGGATFQDQGWSLALTGDGKLYAWGANGSGQLGLGGNSDSLVHQTPAQVVGVGGLGNLTGVAAIAGAGVGVTSIAARQDGTVYAWGANGSGQLGNGTSSQTPSTSPMEVVNPNASATYLNGGMLVGEGGLSSLAIDNPFPPGAQCYLPGVVYCGAFLGDPVNPLSGSYAYTKIDLTIAGRGPSPAFSRTYNSGDYRVTSLGPGWTHGYDARLAFPSTGACAVVVVGPEGRSDCFAQSGSAYVPAAGVSTALAKNGDGTYTATLKDQTAWSFTGDGRLSAIADRYGNTSTLTYTFNATLQVYELTGVGDPAGRGSLALAYDTCFSGRLCSVTDWQAGTARVVSYGYDLSGRLTSVTERDGSGNPLVTAYAYDGTTSHLTTITDANTHVAITNAYDSLGRVVNQQDALTNQTTFSYTPNGDGTTTTTTTYPTNSYDNTHPIVTDTYNAQGQLATQVTQASSSTGETYTTKYTYDMATGNVSTVTDTLNNVTTFCYDYDYTGTLIPGSLGNLTRRIDPLPTGTATSVPVTLYKYDARNNLVETIPPRGVTTGSSVGCGTNLASSVNTTYATDNAYDASGVDLLSTTRRYTDPDLGPQTAVTSFQYGDANNPGRVTKVIPPRGNAESPPDSPIDYSTNFAYYPPTDVNKQAGMLQGTTDPLGDVTTYAYDPVGRRLSMVDPNGNVASCSCAAAHTWRYTYDPQDRPLTVASPAPTTGGTALTTTYAYDAVGNRRSVQDADGNYTRYLYDARDSLQEVDQSATQADPNNDPNKIVTKYTYDNLGNLSRVTRASGDSTNERATDYAYDGLNRLRTETQYPSWPTTTPTLVTSYAYDGNNNRTKLTDPLLKTTTYGYDNLNRLTSMTYTDGTPNVAYGYDLDNNRVSMGDGTGTTSYLYDEMDRVQSVTSPGSSVVGYRYDLDGNRAKVIYPDGTKVTYTFNPASQLASLADWASRQTSYQYFPDGSLKQATNVDGTTATYAYDNALRLTQVSNQLGSAIIDQHTYTLDAVGNRTTLVETLASPGTQNPEAWGLNSSGQLGATSSGTCGMSTPCSLYPISVLGQNGSGNLTGVTAIAAGGNFTLALTSDGHVWAWGDNTYGELGNNSTQANSTTPVPVVGTNGSCCLTGVVAIAAGDAHALALKSDGTMVAWGNGTYGQLGNNGTATANSVPVVVVGTGGSGSLGSIGTIAAGGTHSLALKNDGTAAYAWGRNNHGQLGIGSSDTNAHPVPTALTLPAGTTASAVAGGEAHSLAVVSSATVSGQVYAWGANDSGQLGDDATGTDASSPVAVHGVGGPGTTLTGVVGVAGGFGHSLAVKADGSADAWGLNDQGQLGIGSHTPGPHPAQVEGLNGSGFLLGVTAVAAGHNHSVAVRGKDGAWAWGYNNDGQVGDGSTTQARLTPVQVKGIGGTGTLDGQTQVAAGFYHTLAVATTRQVTTLYGYDKLYRVTSGGTPGYPTSYSYDPAGNRTGQTVGTVSATATYDKADRILTAAGQTYSVDAAGNLTSYPNTTLAYDQANRLKTATISGTTTTYAYDGDGKRASKTVGSTATSYAFDANRSLPVVLTDGALKYVWGVGLAYATDTSGAIKEVYHADGLGSTRALTDSGATIIQTYQTDEFGVPYLTQGTNAQPFRFTGEQRDAESGFEYLRARYYFPSLGRFVSRDTVFGIAASPLSLNRYVYAGNNPVVLADHGGLDWLGTFSHGLIEGAFHDAHPNFLREQSYPGLGIRLDLEDPHTHQFYEIKPWYLAGQGQGDITFYQNVGQGANPPINFQPGPPYDEDYWFNEGPFTLHAWTYTGVPGLILYEWTLELPPVLPIPFRLPTRNPLPKNFPRPWPAPVPATCLSQALQ